MKETPKMRKLYLDIQNKLFYMIPENFTKIYLYTSIIEQVHGMPIGEMYFYYFPKGILKKKPVNVYEIPNKFNIEDDVYSKLINDLYSSIKELREEVIASKQKPWTNFTLIIENLKFSIEYFYDDLTESPYSSYERHIIWRYKYLQTDIRTYNKKEQNLIKRYLQQTIETKGELHQESIYANKKKNVIYYNTDDKYVNDEDENNTEENSLVEPKKEKIPAELEPRRQKATKQAKMEKTNTVETKEQTTEENLEVNQILNIHK